MVRPESRSTHTIVYDDLARTQRTTITTTPNGGPTMTNVGTDTFDWNGNPLTSSWVTSSGTATTSNTFHAMAATCPDTGKTLDRRLTHPRLAAVFREIETAADPIDSLIAS